MSQPLYEITAKHRDLLKLAEESEDMAQAVADTMESIEGDFEEKSISLIHVVNSMAADTTVLDTEIKRLQDRKKTIVNRQEYLREYLLTNMIASGITNITCPLFTISTVKGRDVLQVDDEEAIPTDFLNIKMVKTPMKKELLAELKRMRKEGIDEGIAGVSIGKTKTTIRVK